jgi:peptide/nickel transport system substrate-binding protein
VATLEQLNIRGARLLLCAALLATGLAAGAGCERPASRPNQVVLLNESPIKRVDPRFTFGAWDTKVSRLIAPGLVSVDNPAARAQLALAASIERESDVSYLVTLREDARFPDGRAVDADDVAYTFASVRDPALGSPYRKAWNEILAGVDVVSPRQVRFRLRRPRAPFLTDLDFGIVDRQRAQPQDDALRAAARDGRPPPRFDPLAEPGGAGPFRIVARTADQIELQQNPHAFTRSQLERVVVRTVRDDNARFLALMGKSGDVIQNGIPPMVLETFERDPRLEVSFVPSAMLTYIGFNLSAPVTSDLRVRQAIACAINRPQIVASKFRGHAVLATGMLDPGNTAYAGDVTRWSYDPARARRLLDEAGYPDPDGDGPLPRLHLTWKTSAQRFRVALAQVIAHQLLEVGIEVEVRPFDFATFIDDVNKGNFQLMSLQVTDVVEPDMLRPFFHSSRIPVAENRFDGKNRFHYRNAEVDRWLDRASVVGEMDERRVLYASVQRALAHDLPILPLWHEDNVVAARRSVEGYRVSPTAGLGGLVTASKRDKP